MKTPIRLLRLLSLDLLLLEEERIDKRLGNCSEDHEKYIESHRNGNNRESKIIHGMCLEIEVELVLSSSRQHHVHDNGVLGNSRDKDGHGELALYKPNEGIENTQDQPSPAKACSIRGRDKHSMQPQRHQEQSALLLKVAEDTLAPAEVGLIFYNKEINLL